MSGSEKKQHINNVFSANEKSAVSRALLPDPFVVRSWERCINKYGLDPGAIYRPKIVSNTELLEYKERIDEFLHVARPLMESLFLQVANSGKMVLLTNAQGVTLESFTNPIFSNNSEIPDPCQGAILLEDHEGTNGIGMCLEQKRPISIRRSDHFRASHIGHTCSDSPIFSPYNDLCAVLNVSSVERSESEAELFQTLQMVNVYARRIEKNYFLQEFRNEWVLCLSPDTESGALTDGLMAINGDGRVLAADLNCHQKLAFNEGELLGRHVNQLFEIQLDELMRRADPQPHLKWPMRALRNGFQFLVTLRSPGSKASRSPKKAINVSDAVAEEAQQGCLTLKSLAGQDPQMIYNISCINRVMNKDISIILHGETGTGKEAFAQAIHSASNRASRPFVALNCASIPESLIESELFGYMAGAFTGAKSKGMRGKILQSDGGTLFLDEIGDMPIQLQTRLLRVLAEKEVAPLGSESPMPVDLHIICATHRNIKELVASGAFREDLYYRLNGVTLNLPALDERADKASLIKFAFAVEAGEQLDKFQIRQDAFNAIMNYSWPGNIRQLRNALRFALAINECGTIGLQDLPPEIALASDHSAPNGSEGDYGDTLALKGLSSMERAERDAVLKELENNKWKVSSAAVELGLARATMYRKMKKYNLVPPNQR